jgi:hypothetical protein
MFCKKEWGETFVEASMTKVWRMDVYRPYRRGILLEREKVLLPEAQVFAEREVAARRKDQHAEQALIRADELQAHIRELEKQMKVARHNVFTLRQEAHALRTNQRNPGDDEVQAKRNFVKKCPVETCEGFLSTAWKCGICDMWSCSECHEVKGRAKDAPHVCNPDTVASVKLIGTTTKPCPRCRTEIEKRSGCNQMWCTQCHCLWDWRTGEVDMTRNHNPEYVDYIQRTGARGGAGAAPPRALGDIPCGGLPDAALLRNALTKLKATPPQSTYIMNANRTAIHIADVEIPALRPRLRPDEPVARFLEWSVKKLVGDTLTDEQWGSEIEKKDWYYSKVQRMMDILQMITLAAADILQPVLRSDNLDVAAVVAQLEELRTIANTSLKQLAHAKVMTEKLISDDWKDFGSVAVVKRKKQLEKVELVSIQEKKVVFKWSGKHLHRIWYVWLEHEAYTTQRCRTQYMQVYKSPTNPDEIWCTLTHGRFDDHDGTGNRHPVHFCFEHKNVTYKSENTLLLSP